MATASVNPRAIAQWRITAQDVERELADVIEDCTALVMTDACGADAQELLRMAAEVFAAQKQAQQVGSADGYYDVCVRRAQALMRGVAAMNGAPLSIRAIGGSLLKRGEYLSKMLGDVSLTPEGKALAKPGDKTQATAWLLQSLALSDKLAPSLAADLIDKPEIAALMAGFLTAMDAELVGAFALTDKAEIIRAMDAADAHLGGIMDAGSTEGLMSPLSWGLLFGIDKTLSDGAEWVRTCDEPGSAASAAEAAPSEIRTIARALLEGVTDLTNRLENAIAEHERELREGRKGGDGAAHA